MDGIHNVALFLSLESAVIYLFATAGVINAVVLGVDSYARDDRSGVLFWMIFGVVMSAFAIAETVGEGSIAIVSRIGLAVGVCALLVLVIKRRTTDDKKSKAV